MLQKLTGDADGSISGVDLALVRGRAALAHELAKNVHRVRPLHLEADLGEPDGSLRINQMILGRRTHDLVVADEVDFDGVRHLALQDGRVTLGSELVLGLF